MLDIEINFVNLENLCDDWGFKENEIIDAHNMLRSTQANLAVLEGKIIGSLCYYAQRIVREKHSKLDHTRRDLVYSGLHP
ncbi:BnaA04g10180D [Brassica napus]|uniref:BnaA04g10180D protein n=1 Tax=Brassica napus TaxID=3708 RepID=A0A078I3H2_BRANA|nr:BnaA04g10180D [Brassica napus]